jgi:carboxypeptidase Taq
MTDKFEQLEEELKPIQNLQYINGLLGWDKEVIMPEKGQQARIHQQSTLSKLQHRLVTSDKIDTLLDEINRGNLSKRQKAILREFEREKKKADEVPEDLMEKISEKSSETVEVWREDREEDRFDRFAENLQELVELKREYAYQIDPDKEPYQVLFKDYEPFLEFETMEEILETLKQELVPLIDDIKDSDADITTDAFEGDFTQEKQEKINESIARDLGFPEESGRIDVSTHPFTSGNTFDTRITTRYNPEDLSESILPTVHETGHALYQLGLPEDEYNSPVGEARDLSVHESQSRLWENHVGRSKAFWKYMLPKVEEEFPEVEGTSLQDCYESINQVYEDNLIRVNADELTYHLHIIIRFEIERALVNGDIEVEDLPEVWNEKMEQYLGITPDNHKEGVMQDIHWAWGDFGYFPTYTLGSVLAAQIYDTAEEEVDDVDEKIEEGDFEPLLDWLRENIHKHGKLYETEELVKKATGQEPTPEPFLEYVEEKYSQLYNL